MEELCFGVGEVSTKLYSMSVNVYITLTNSQAGLQDFLHIVTQQGNGLCDHLCSPALCSQGSYVTATGVSGKWEGDKTRCGRNYCRRC